MNIKRLSNKEANWPSALDNITPIVEQLYICGELPDGPRIGVIGSRRPTEYGKQVVEQLVKPLAAAEITIVSGLAIGIDGLAHRAALDAGGKTIAVLPSSIDRIYPARHHRLATTVTNNGAVVSEYEHDTKARRYSFIARNRIIAALSDVLLVIEAAEKSGTMHTVNFANQIGVDVAAVPGPINNLYSKGTNKLIQEGAYLVDDAKTLFELIGYKPNPEAATLRLAGDEAEVYKILEREPLNFDSLSARVKIDQIGLRSALSNLEIENLVAYRMDGMYARR